MNLITVIRYELIHGDLLLYYLENENVVTYSEIKNNRAVVYCVYCNKKTRGQLTREPGAAVIRCAKCGRSYRVVNDET